MCHNLGSSSGHQMLLPDMKSRDWLHKSTGRGEVESRFYRSPRKKKINLFCINNTEEVFKCIERYEMEKNQDIEETNKFE